MVSAEPCYCELCGRPVYPPSLCRTVVVEGVTLRVCPDCYRKLVKQGKAREVAVAKPITRRNKESSKKWTRTRISRRVLEEEYDIVEDYAERIRRARQRMGWSQAVLAQKVREKENVIKRIEAGRLKPSIELARRLERVLGITLLEPIVDETPIHPGRDDEDYYTVGDFVRFKGK